VRWGGAHVQYFTMPWDLGPRKAKEYLFTGDYIDAATARDLGLVNRVVPLSTGHCMSPASPMTART
jgi:enoyl-CoA hydratase